MRHPLPVIRQAWALACIIVLGTILATGCIFDPREGPEPSGDAAPWITPTSVINVMANMREAINAMQDPNYNNSLSPAFVFNPASNDSAEAPAGYFDDNFRKDRELNALRKLFTRADSLDVQWIFDENDDLTEDGNSATLNLNYQLFVQFTNGDQELFENEAFMYFEKDAENVWLLKNWTEQGFNAVQSWGRLRANLEIYE